ncbi:MAG TPA: HIT family protein [Pyrinomonadaceae bacterium]|nr:HIT family protein [Pyrinomonadaceae bacterium]
MTAVTDSGCVFCQIVAGRAPASVVYEDERVLAFMDIRPVNPGQLMVIPREHVDHFCDLADDLACHMLVQAQRLSRNLRERLKPERVGLVVHGYGVAHAHLIVVPQHGPDDITSARLAYTEGGQIKFGVGHLKEESREELDRLARLLS